jgi:hypothetical protein
MPGFSPLVPGRYGEKESKDHVKWHFARTEQTTPASGALNRVVHLLHQSAAHRKTKFVDHSSLHRTNLHVANDIRGHANDSGSDYGHYRKPKEEFHQIFSSRINLISAMGCSDFRSHSKFSELLLRENHIRRKRNIPSNH